MQHVVKAEDFVLVDGDQIVTDSRTVARHFGRTHRYVLKRVRDLLDETQDWGMQLFLHTPYIEAQNGKTYDNYRMTKDGFMLLVMGFTGKKALQVKRAFLEAFNRMADFIREQAMGAWADYNRAYQQHLSDKREASRHGLGLRVWQDVKPQQVAMLERMHPQMSLFPH